MGLRILGLGLAMQEFGLRGFGLRAQGLGFET